VRGTTYLVVIAMLLWASAAEAIPYFARKYDVGCATCHLLPPLLNETGQSFVANGYRFARPRGTVRTLPLAVWLTQRVEVNPAGTVKAFPNRVEVISSDAVTPWLSYFAEWRTLSLQTTGANRLLDRSGRFEDLFLLFRLPQQLSVTVGQFRMLNQWDVSRRLTLSEPLAFSAGVAGESSRNTRLQGLRAFSLAGRAPAVRTTWQSLTGGGGADGWFHEITVPFTGELTLPLGSNARRNASFELEGRPKGLVYETYFRRSLSSAGLAMFAGDDRWVANLTGTLRLADHHLLVSVGRARFQTAQHEYRLSIGSTWVPRPWFAAGARLDDRSAAGVRASFFPHVNFNFPGEKFTFLVVVEQRVQRRNHGLAIELSGVF
jgi:hypothetical protein